MSFSHPLARNAKVWSSAGPGEQARKLLVVVTTLELNPEHRKFKRESVDRLKGAVQEWLSENQQEAEGYLLMNRLKDW